MQAMHTPDAQMVSAGLLAARLVLGPLMAAHGAQKLFGWFGGPDHGATWICAAMSLDRAAYRHAATITPAPAIVHSDSRSPNTA